ncbi:hypothetical protein SAZ11_12550 [Streptomyces sp. FXJ1.4098]|nr:hypothetical protein [Streptomyces sp. FXJ1.4098]
MRGRPLLTAVAALALVFLLGPILLVVAIAFSSGDTVEFPPPGLSGKWFTKALAYQPFQDALTTSALVAAGPRCSRCSSASPPRWRSSGGGSAAARRPRHCSCPRRSSPSWSWASRCSSS